jgi:hypothetical protein
MKMNLAVRDVETTNVRTKSSSTYETIQPKPCMQDLASSIVKSVPEIQSEI